MAAVVAIREDPQLGEQEVVERRELRREDRADEVMDPQAVGQGEEGELIDPDADDADDRELRRAEKRLEEVSNSRPAQAELIVDRLDGDSRAPQAGSIGTAS
jgi:hypothetical protein